MRTVEFLKVPYVVEGTVGAPEGAIFLDTLPAVKLIELCNLLISNLDLGKRIKMFQNKGKGVKRVTDLLLKYDVVFADPPGGADPPVTGDCDEPAAKKRADLEVPRGKVREGSKQAALIDLLKRPDGASIKEIVEALNWVSHTARGAISRDVKKRLGYVVTTSKVEGRGRVYRIEA